MVLYNNFIQLKPCQSDNQKKGGAAWPAELEVSPLEGWRSFWLIKTSNTQITLILINNMSDGGALCGRNVSVEFLHGRNNRGRLTGEHFSFLLPGWNLFRPANMAGSARPLINYDRKKVGLE